MVCAGWDTTYYSAVLFYTGLTLLLLIAYWFIQKDARVASRKELVYDKEALKGMMKFGLPLMPASIIAWLNTSISNLLIKQKLTFSALGVYSSAVSIASLINQHFF